MASTDHAGRHDGEATGLKRQAPSGAWWRPRLVGGGPPRGWKPLSTSWLSLGALAALSLAAAAGIETLAQRSLERGGLALAATLNDVPRAAVLAARYLPNVAAALYSLLWNWVDLDVKRMQPWLELSRGGVRGEDSLFLDYPCEFVGFVPWTSARRRHWPVFLSGTIMVIVYAAITPLQSGILGTHVLTHQEPVNIVNRAQLVPLAQQNSLIGPEILNAAYAIGWLGQEYPPFSTSDYALLPYYVGVDHALKKSEANWTATTTMLSTELTCWPATVSRCLTGFCFVDGKGCNTTVALVDSPHYYMYYIGYYSSPYADFNLGDYDCPETPDSIHKFLAIWAKVFENNKLQPGSNITALYCQPHYYKQQVVVTVSAGNFRPHHGSLHAVSERRPLTDSEFNSTAFEYLLGNGMPVSAETMTRDAPFRTVVEQHPKLILQYNLFEPTSNMVGFALAGQNLSTKNYSDPRILERAYDRAHKHLFSVAVSRLLVNETHFANHTATSTYTLSGVVVSRVISLAVESLLVLIAVLTITLLWFYHKAPCLLRSNPNSISRLVEIFRNSPALLDTFRHVDIADDKTLLSLFRNDRFRLSRLDGADEPDVCLERVGETSCGGKREKLEIYYDPVRPFPLTLTVGAIFATILVSAITVIAWLKTEERARTGLSRPSENIQILQLLENYIPTVFATLVESFWVLLNRLLCVMQPFRELWAGQAKSSRTIDTTYSAIPPQLSLWRAIRARHYVVALVCMTALVANLLGVGLSALFNENQVTAKYPHTFEPVLSAAFNNDTIYNETTLKYPRNHAPTGEYQDHLYVAMANISNNTPLPPWVSPGYFFQPHRIGDDKRNAATDTYRLQTRGFGGRANCTAVPTMFIPLSKYDEKSVTCPDPILLVGSKMRHDTLPERERSDGRCAVEDVGIVYESHLLPGKSSLSCPLSATVGWGRTPDGHRVKDGRVEASFSLCRPYFETAMFSVTVDALGNVLSYDRISELEPSLHYPGTDDHIREIVYSTSKDFFLMEDSMWHNDLVARNWMDYLVSVVIGSREFIGPHNPPPDPTALIPAIEDIYRRIFALYLAFNTQFFEPGDANKTVVGTRLVAETRIFLDPSAFIISLTVLSFNLVVVVVYYARAAVFVLPRMPTTIGSILAYTAPSRVVNSRVFGRQNRTFGFGRYVGPDGHVRTGIEMDPHVVHIDPASLDERNGLWRRLVRGLPWAKKPPIPSTTWL